MTDLEKSEVVAYFIKMRNDAKAMIREYPADIWKERAEMCEKALSMMQAPVSA